MNPNMWAPNKADWHVFAKGECAGRQNDMPLEWRDRRPVSQQRAFAADRLSNGRSPCHKNQEPSGQGGCLFKLRKATDSDDVGPLVSSQRQQVVLVTRHQKIRRTGSGHRQQVIVIGVRRDRDRGQTRHNNGNGSKLIDETSSECRGQAFADLRVTRINSSICSTEVRRSKQPSRQRTTRCAGRELPTSSALTRMFVSTTSRIPQRRLVERARRVAATASSIIDSNASGVMSANFARASAIV
jgi:hypothetical protein